MAIDLHSLIRAFAVRVDLGLPIKRTSEDYDTTARLQTLIWAASWQYQQNGMCAQRRLRSAWTSAQSGLIWVFAGCTVILLFRHEAAQSVFSERKCSFVRFAIHRFVGGKMKVSDDDDDDDDDDTDDTAVHNATVLMKFSGENSW